MMANHFRSNTNFRGGLQQPSHPNRDEQFLNTSNFQSLPPRGQQGPSAPNQHSFRHIPPQNFNLTPPPPPPFQPLTSSMLHANSCEGGFRNTDVRTYQMNTSTNTQPQINFENKSIRLAQPHFGNQPQQLSCNIGNQPQGSFHNYSSHITQPFHNFANQSHDPVQNYDNQSNNFGSQTFEFRVNCPPLRRGLQPQVSFQSPGPPVMQPSESNANFKTLPLVTKSFISVEKSSLSSFTLGSEKCKGNEDWWINQWMQKVRARIDKENNDICPSNLKIFDIQKKLVKFATLVSELDSIVSQLSVISQEPNQQEWEISVRKSRDLKKELEDLRCFFSEKENLCRIKEILSKRREKRHKWREGNERRAKLKLKIKEERKHKEKEIDDTLKKLHDVEKEKFQEEKMKKEADAVLREVRTKQEEVTKMQRLLEGLSTLREIRKKKGEVHGFVEDSRASAFFDKMKNEFDGLFSEQQDLYRAEEQALKIMMEGSRALFSQPRKDCDQPSLNLPELKKSLFEIYFGKNESKTKEYERSFLAAEESVEILVKRRKDWDQYLVPNDDPRGSSVPVGWVVPNSNPKEEWIQFQQSN